MRMLDQLSVTWEQANLLQRITQSGVWSQNYFYDALGRAAAILIRLGQVSCAQLAKQAFGTRGFKFEVHHLWLYILDIISGHMILSNDG